jgi:deoxyribodipyrimidine photo-lyase
MSRPTGDATLVWLRNDLRLADNPALSAAVATGGPVVVVHIEPTDAALRRRGAASRWWLHHSLRALAAGLAARSIGFETLAGPTSDLLRDAIKRHGVRRMAWNRRYGPAERALDAQLKTSFRSDGLEVESHPGDALIEPFEIATGTGGPYGVYTPFWKNLRQRTIAPPLPAPEPIGPAQPVGHIDASYVSPHWAGKLAAHWQIGEAAAAERLADFLDEAVSDYPAERDIPAIAATSRLSPHLAFGEISPRQVWHAAQVMAQRAPEKAAAIDKFLSELAWRDFNIHQLYYRADIAAEPMQAKYQAMPWREPGDDLERWQRGETGIPIVDAGLRELWATGYMHNRVRMIVASLLTKNLMIDWRLGEQWFWDTLFDADPANNPGNWQWVAGCGLDAAPFFRIFNPVTQGERFDPEGHYVRRWVPEVADLADQWLHHPWDAPRGVRNYPAPIVDLKASRERALAAMQGL